MKIQKGIVKYKDRNDIVCTYGVTDDGRQYYFLDETDSKKLSNGNRIATTALVEAIDPMVKASNVGVIDNDGNVIVMFDNRSIKPINDEIILVEKAEPVSETVIEANNLRSDPLSATKLVSTPATIKDRLNAQMGGEGRYIFNDQFSEATLCDINGNNLLNGELYSFIAMTNDKIYLSKNTADSVINELVIGTPVDVQNPVNDTQSIDVGSTVVDQSVVENALTGDNSMSGLVASEGVSQEEALASAESATTGEIVEEVMPYNDEISTVFEENNVPVDTVTDSTGFDLPEEPIPYNDEISTIVDESQNVPAPALGEEVTAASTLPVEEVMPYDDGISTIVDESQNVPAPALGEEVTAASTLPVEEVMPYDDGISTIVDESLNTSVPALGEENIPAVEEQVQSEITDSTGFELPSELVANDQVVSALNNEDEVVMPPVVEENEVEPVAEKVDDEKDEITSSIDTKVVGEENPAEEISLKEVTPDTISASNEVALEKEEDKVFDMFSEEPKADVSSESEVNDTEEVAFSSDLYSNDNNQNQPLEDNYNYKDTSLVMNNGSLDNYSTSNVSNEVSYSNDYYDRKPIETYGSSKYTLPTRDSSQYSRYSGYDSVFKSSMMKPDRITPAMDYYDAFNVDYKKSGDSKSIMNDVARSMTELMRQNKEQKGVIIQFQEKLDAVESQRRILSEKYNDQCLRVDSLSSKLRSLDDVTTRLESKNQMLESRLRDQEKIIAAQERELNTLRPQLEGRQDLIKILADAKVLLGDDDEYQEDSYYGRRAA